MECLKIAVKKFKKKAINLVFFFRSEDLQIMPNCTIGSGNLDKEVLTVNHDVDLF